MSSFLFGFRQVSLEILHSETGWAAIVLPTSHARGLLQQMFGHAHVLARVCVCLFWFTLDFISIPVSFKYKITIFLDWCVFLQRHGDGITYRH